MGLRIAGRPAWLTLALALALVGLAASGSAVAGRAAPAPPSLTIDAPSLSGKWREGWFGLSFDSGVRRLRVLKRATLTVSGTVGVAASLQVSLRSVDRPGGVTATTAFPGGPGRYSGTLTLPIRPLPGKYRVTVRVVGTSDTTLARAQRDVDFPAPVEGVVGKATASASRYGPPLVVLRSRHQAFARFHFLTPPTRRDKLRVQWRTPNNDLVCQGPHGPLPDCKLPVPYRATVYTSLRSPRTELTRGNWYCELSVNGILARRVFVRLR